MRKIGEGLREELAPLVQVLTSADPADRRAWLDDLRETAPALSEVLERLSRDALRHRTANGLIQDCPTDHHEQE
ncbi:MAG: hypothetical protein IT353_16085 [Gemmatimonadaceae bacterium]|nr:hypothetical protein [Gemmatimonadaceae bacterium]